MTVTELEAAVLGALEADSTLAESVRKFMVLPSLGEEVLEQLTLQFPTLGVISPSGTFSEKFSGVQDEAAKVLVVCIQSNLRTRTAAAGGDGHEPGVWDLLDECRRVLQDADLTEEGILDCTAVRRELIVSNATWSAAMLELDVLVRR